MPPTEGRILIDGTGSWAQIEAARPAPAGSAIWSATCACFFGTAARHLNLTICWSVTMIGLHAALAFCGVLGGRLCGNHHKGSGPRDAKDRRPRACLSDSDNLLLGRACWCRIRRICCLDETDAGRGDQRLESDIGFAIAKGLDGRAHRAFSATTVRRFPCTDRTYAVPPRLAVSY